MGEGSDSGEVYSSLYPRMVNKEVEKRREKLYVRSSVARPSGGCLEHVSRCSEV